MSSTTPAGDRHELKLRFAGVEDVGLVLGYIRELAACEHLAHEVEADEALLRETLFGERQVAEVLLAERGGEPAGFALFFHSFSTFVGRPGLYLEDLYVPPAHRGAGVGKALLKALAEIARERRCGRIEWSVLDWNAPAIGFYHALGASPQDEWTTFRLSGAALDALADGESATPSSP